MIRTSITRDTNKALTMAAITAETEVVMEAVIMVAAMEEAATLEVVMMVVVGIWVEVTSSLSSAADLMWRQVAILH